MKSAMEKYLDLLIAAVAFTVQAAMDLDEESNSNERVLELRELETRLMEKLRVLCSYQIPVMTHDLSYAIMHLGKTAQGGAKNSLNSNDLLAWKSWVAAYMKMVNKQFNGLRLPKITFDDLNEDGRKQVRTEFEEWWKPIE